jgi:RNase P/RNase MRP subunit p30
MPGALDINVNIPREEELNPFIEMALRLGFAGIAVGCELNEPIKRLDNGFLLLKRTDLKGSTKENLKKQLKRTRHHSVIVSAPIVNMEVANWAAGDSRIDLLSPVLPYSGCKLRESTAKLAASSGIALEIPVGSLLTEAGMTRAKTIKAFRAAIATALSVEMPIVLTSSATVPLAMRAPMAMRHIGYLLGLDRHSSKSAVADAPNLIISVNEKKLSKRYVADGIELADGDAEI